jgi:hypothetical protein
MFFFSYLLSVKPMTFTEEVVEGSGGAAELLEVFSVVSIVDSSVYK